MVLIKHLCSQFQIQQVFRGFFPRQIKNPLYIGPDNVGLGGIRVHHLKTFKLLACLFPGILGHFFLLDLFAQPFNLLAVGIVITQFFLQGLHLFAQEIFTLRT